MTARDPRTEERRAELRRFLLAHGVPLRDVPADVCVRTDGVRVFLERYRRDSGGRIRSDADGEALREEFSVEAISPVLIPAWISDCAD